VNCFEVDLTLRRICDGLGWDLIERAPDFYFFLAQGESELKRLFEDLLLDLLRTGLWERGLNTDDRQKGSGEEEESNESDHRV